MRYTVYIKIIQRLQSWRNFLYQNEKRLSVSDNDLKVILFLWKARKEKFLNMSVYTHLKPQKVCSPCPSNISDLFKSPSKWHISHSAAFCFQNSNKIITDFQHNGMFLLPISTITLSLLLSCSRRMDWNSNVSWHLSHYYLIKTSASSDIAHNRMKKP